MRFGFADACLHHDPGPRHPESADRVQAVRRALDRTHGVTFVDPDPATREDLHRVHPADHVDEIAALCRDGGGALDSDTVVSEGTWEAALASAGLAIWAATTTDPDGRRTEIPFAIGRPPGHHALAGQSMGFCIFNNVAVATEAALATPEVDTVGIVDWDVHHGNGTQAIFEDRDDVAFASVHEEGLYPGTGDRDETGSGAGAGDTLNVPLQSGANLATYVAVMDEVILPWIASREPDRLLVSAGFDAHEHDPISRMGLTTEGYGCLTHRLLDVADRAEAGIGFILEGGYGLGTLAESVVMVNDVCNGYEPIEPTGDPRDRDRRRIDDVRERHGLGS